MLRKDGTGPLGQGPMSNGGIGLRGQRGQIGAGLIGYCVCPKCGEKTAHIVGRPCTSMKCPKCGATMIRGS